MPCDQHHPRAHYHRQHYSDHDADNFAYIDAYHHADKYADDHFYNNRYHDRHNYAIADPHNVFGGNTDNLCRDFS